MNKELENYDELFLNKELLRNILKKEIDSLKFGFKITEITITDNLVNLTIPYRINCDIVWSEIYSYTKDMLILKYKDYIKTI